VTGASTCNCPPGFNGTDCAQDINECSEGDNSSVFFPACVSDPALYYYFLQLLVSGPA
jgi:hypothetical protein